VTYLSESKAPHSRGSTRERSVATGTRRHDIPYDVLSDKYYEPHGIALEETADLQLEFELETVPGDDTRPVRVLTRFAFFDTDRGDLLVDLENVKKPGVTVRGAGIVLPCIESEEDEAMDDDLDDEEKPTEQELRLDEILDWEIDFTDRNKPLYIRTEHSWYELSSPSNRYRRYYRNFYRPLRIQQLVISTAHADPTLSYTKFLENTNGIDIVGKLVDQNDIRNSENVRIRWQKPERQACQL